MRPGPLILVLNSLASNVRDMFSVTLFRSDFDLIMETVYMLEIETVAGDIMTSCIRCVFPQLSNHYHNSLSSDHVSFLRCLQFENGFK